jgi:hypothetical protein
MTRSARPRSDSGIVSPSAFAVSRLTTSAYLVGCPPFLRYVSLLSTSVPAAESMPPMPLTSETLQFGT